MINSLFWNIHGISKVPNFCRLSKLVRMHNIQILDIFELKTYALNIEAFRIKLHFDYISCNSEGNIWVFLKHPFMFPALSCNQQHVTLKIRHPHLPCPITLSFVHARCKREDRLSVWEDLLTTKPLNTPWLVCGDFNLVLNSKEKREGRILSNVEILEFSSFLSKVGLFDNGFRVLFSLGATIQGE